MARHGLIFALSHLGLSAFESRQGTRTAQSKSAPFQGSGASVNPLTWKRMERVARAPTFLPSSPLERNGNDDHR